MENITKNFIFLLLDEFKLFDLSVFSELLRSTNNNEINYCDISFSSINEKDKVKSSNGIEVNVNPNPDLKSSDLIIIFSREKSHPRKWKDESVALKWISERTKGKNIRILISGGIDPFMSNEAGYLEYFNKNNISGFNIINRSPFRSGIILEIESLLAMIVKDLGRDAALKASESINFLSKEYGTKHLSNSISYRTKNIFSLILWLKSRISLPTSVKEMSDFLNTSERRLYAHCQEIFQCGPSQLFTEIRLNHSKQLLKNEAYTIKEVSYICGFSQTAAFSRAFSRIFGVYPSEYRKERKNNTNRREEDFGTTTHTYGTKTPE